MADLCAKFRILTRGGPLLRIFVCLLLKRLVFILPVLVRVAFVTLLERKVLSLVGLRVGPNKVSILGFLQPLGDAAKLSNKQSNCLSNFNFFFYYITSLLILFSSIFLWVLFFFDPSRASLKFSVLILLVILSVNSFNSILAGWSTFSKYSLIGRVRTVSQLVSYESSLYLCLFSLVFLFFSFNFSRFLYLGFNLSFLFLLPFFYIWIPSFLAELNRTPYDFSEGERELVRGYNTEFGSVGFTLLFLSEYSNIIFFSFLSSFIFFSGLEFFFSFLLFFFVIWIRSVLPRFRFDKLMLLAWKFFIPFLTFVFLCIIFSY